MPEAQPGQEQRMEGPKGRCGKCGERLRNCSCFPRPTADLGDDGELVERLRAKNTNGFADLPSYRNPDGPEAADRIELLREALEAAATQLEACADMLESRHVEPLATRAAARIARSVLSK